MLGKMGIDVHVSPLFSDEYVRALQTGHRSIAEIVRGYIRRSSILLARRDFDLLWIEKDVLPWLPALFEMPMLRRFPPFVVDYDDAVFHSYDLHRNACVRWALSDKHRTIMQRASAVCTGSQYLMDYAIAAGGRRVVLIPTAVDLNRYARRTADNSAPGASGVPTIVGWIGQRATARMLSPLASLFRELRAGNSARFVAVGIDPSDFGLPMEGVEWSEQTEVATISGFDVGIMPLIDEPFERGKCGYKLIQYMACGLPVVASPVGVNRQLVEHGVNGFLADTPHEWKSALLTLSQDGELRRRMGRAGREKVEQTYCTGITGPQLAHVLQTAI